MYLRMLGCGRGRRSVRYCTLTLVRSAPLGVHFWIGHIVLGREACGSSYRQCLRRSSAPELHRRGCLLSSWFLATVFRTMATPTSVPAAPFPLRRFTLWGGLPTALTPRRPVCPEAYGTRCSLACSANPWPRPFSREAPTTQ